MKSLISLRRLGLEKSGPLRAGHPECGRPCLLCKRPIQAGDEVGHIPQNPEDERSATLVAHWKCIEDGFNRLRGSEVWRLAPLAVFSNPGPEWSKTATPARTRTPARPISS